MKLKLELSLDDVNKLLTGLDYYKKDLDNLGQEIISVSQIQIDEYNKKLEEEQEKNMKETDDIESSATESAEIKKSKKEEEKGDSK